jgi:hypothetical protein
MYIYTQAGDIIGVTLNFNDNTIEFFKNSVSQGVAFTFSNPGPFYAAISITATGSMARLLI